jgi:elongation factor Tu
MPVFVRTVAPFLRTARSALQQGNSVSPLRHALLRNQKGAAVLNAARSYAVAFERTKPHVNIGMFDTRISVIHLLTILGTIGHVDHGKVYHTAIRRCSKTNQIRRLH